MDKSVIDQIVTGLVEPHVYAFLTHDVPRYLKVGDTYRPVRVRIEEWRKKGFDIRGDAYRSWSALLGDGVFFRDYAVHEYLTRTAGMERITEEQLRKLPRADEGDKDVPYSREFFRYADDSQPESTVVADVSGNVDAAIADIARYHSGKGGSKQAYTIYDVKDEATAAQAVKILKTPRDNQKKAIARFFKATDPANMPRKGKKLLMYAVMRFGKTFTSLCCAREMQIDATHKGARLVVVVSAKKDVGGEWESEVRNTRNFEEYEFLDADNLKRNDAVLKQVKSKSRKFVVFLTLQSFLRKKAWLEQLFKSRIDLLIVDETHFAARAEKMGKVLADPSRTTGKGLSDVDRDDDSGESLKSEDEDAAVDSLSLNARVRLHLSGTPYRILMHGEFPEEDIVAFCQYTDIIDAQAEWDRDHLGKVDAMTGREYAEWDNPYYGFPQMVRFAFNPNPAALEMIRRARENDETCSFSEIFRPAVDENGGFTGKFVHEREVTEFLRVFNGSDEGEKTGFIALFKYLKDRKIRLCSHVVMVLPYCASCDAMENLLRSGEYDLLGEYEILNISGHKRSKVFDDPAAVKAHIRKCDAANPPKKTLTLTVNRMLTGSTVPEWDTMVFLKETKSPQEYDQAIFRLQSPHVMTIRGRNPESGAEETIRRNLKPQTLLVDFNPGRMFRMQEFKGQVYNDNVGKKGHEELQRRIRKELEVSPIIFCNADRLKQAEYVDVVNEVRAYTGTRGVSEEVQEIAVDVDDIFRDKALYSLISNENPLDASGGLTVKAAAGEGEEFRPTDTKRPETEKSKGEIKRESEDEKLRAEMASRFRSYMRRVLFYVFLIAKDGKPETKVATLNEVIASVKGVENLRIAKNIRINRKDLMNLRKINSKVLSQFEYAISRTSELAHDPKKADPIDRALTAVRKFGRIGDAEIVTPQKIARQMVDQIQDAEWKKMVVDGEKILDLASKIGEFAIAVSRKLNRDCGLPVEAFRSSICAIATSGISYEFTRKVYELLGLDTSCVADPERLTSYRLLEVKTDGKIDYGKIARILRQRKPFNTISTNDNVGERARKMNTYGTVISNPPYQENQASEKCTVSDAMAGAIYPRFIDVARNVSPKRVIMITPSRWMTKSGRGISGEWVDRLIGCDHFVSINDFPVAAECFNNVEIKGGVSYFNYSELYNGTCRFVVHRGGKASSSAFKLNASGSGVVIRDDRAKSIMDKVAKVEGEDYYTSRTFSSLVGPNTLFCDCAKGILNSNWRGYVTARDSSHTVKYYLNRNQVKCGFAWIRRSDMIKSFATLNLHKVYIPEAGGSGTDAQILGVPFYGEPGSICSQTYLCIGYDPKRHHFTKGQCKNIISYIKTRFFRYMVSIKKKTQHAFSSAYQFVPVQDFDEAWTDEKLYRKYGITKEEQAFIESMIKPMA